MPNGTSVGHTSNWKEAWDEFKAAFVRHCPWDKLEAQAQNKFKEAFKESVGKVVDNKKEDWKKNDCLTTYAQFVLLVCAGDLGLALAAEPQDEKITKEKLQAHAVRLTREKWKPQCPGTAEAAPAAPEKMLGTSCDDLLRFFGEATFLNH